MRSSALFLLLALLPASSYGQSPQERELALLTAQRDKAVEAATAPIHRKYREALEQLLKKAMAASDLDGAIKIREALEKAPDDADPFSDLEAAIEGTKWLWPIEFAGNTPEDIRWISFGPDKEIKHGWHGYTAAWRLVKPNVIELTQAGKVEFVWKMEFDPKFKKATVSKINERKDYPMRIIEQERDKAK